MSEWGELHDDKFVTLVLKWCMAKILRSAGWYRFDSSRLLATGFLPYSIFTTRITNITSDTDNTNQEALTDCDANRVIFALCSEEYQSNFSTTLSRVESPYNWLEELRYTVGGNSGMYRNLSSSPLLVIVPTSSLSPCSSYLYISG